jgi:hypothetical protein
MGRAGFRRKCRSSNRNVQTDKVMKTLNCAFPNHPAHPAFYSFLHELSDIGMHAGSTEPCITLASPLISAK